MVLNVLNKQQNFNSVKLNYNILLRVNGLYGFGILGRPFDHVGTCTRFCSEGRGTHLDSGFHEDELNSFDD